MGLIEDIDTFLRLGLDITSPEWTNTLACSAVALAIGPDRKLVDQLGDVPANFFSIIVGPSRIEGKTVPIKKLRHISRELTRMHNSQVISNAGYKSLADYEKDKKIASKPGKKSDEEKEIIEKLEKIEDKLVDYVLPEEWSSEGLLTLLSKKGKNVGIIHGDEFTQMVKGARQKDYMSGQFEGISRLYDNELPSHATVARGYERADEGVYAIFVSATTYYMLTLLDDNFFIQGTGNRCLWIVADDKEESAIDDTKSVPFWFDDSKNAEMGSIEFELLERLKRIGQFPKGVYLPDMEAGKRMYTYMKLKLNESIKLFNKNKLDPDAGYIGGMAQNAMKLALIHFFSRLADEEIPHTTVDYEIEIEDVEWAISKVERHYLHYKKLRDVSLEFSNTGTVKSQRQEWDKVLRIIDKFGGYASQTQISQLVAWKNLDRQQVLDAMVGANLIEFIQNENKKGGGYKRVS